MLLSLKALKIIVQKLLCFSAENVGVIDPCPLPKPTTANKPSTVNP
jgi:hypothetical protein